MKQAMQPGIGAGTLAIAAAWTAAILLTPAGAPRAAEPRDHVVIVLDASGSMRGKLSGTNQDKMSAAKEALKEVLSTVPASTHIGLLVFSASNLKEDWVYPLGPRVDEELTRAIDSPNAGSGTPLGRYIKRGADRLLEERAKQFGYGSYRLLVVTDGEASDRNLVERYAPEVIARGITMDVIGVGMRETHTLAKQAHSYRAANDPASLKQALAEVFAEVGGAGDDVAAGEAFAWLAPIPIETAAAALQALATSGNHPIGQKSPSETGPAGGSTTPGASASPAPNTPASASASTPHPVRQESGGGLSKWILIPFLFVGMVIVMMFVGMVWVVIKVARGWRR